MSKPYDPKLVLQKLSQKGVHNYICPFCRGNSFFIHSDFSTVLLSSEAKEIQLNSFIPVAVLVCKNCGHIDMFSLLQLGAIDGEEVK